MDESKEEGSELIITGDPTKLLELEKERFHKMAFLIKMVTERKIQLTKKCQQFHSFCIRPL